MKFELSMENLKHYKLVTKYFKLQQFRIHFITISLFLLFTGPRYRRPKQTKEKSEADEKRPRTAFSNEQLARLKVICSTKAIDHRTLLINIFFHFLIAA